MSIRGLSKGDVTMPEIARDDDYDREQHLPPHGAHADNFDKNGKCDQVDKKIRQMK